MGQIRPATRTTLRHWLGEHCAEGDAEFALEGCIGWRYVCEEPAAAGVGVHLGDPAEIAALRGPKKRAKTDRADARLLRTLLLEGRFPESWIPPAHVLEIRSLGRLYCTLMDERGGHGSSASTPRCSTRAARRFGRCCRRRAARRLRQAELYATGRQSVDTALRRIEELSVEIEPLRTQLIDFARRQAAVRRCSATTASAGCARRSSGPRSVMRAGSPVPISWCALPGWMSPCTPRPANAHRGICRGRVHRSCGGRRSRRPSALPVAGPRITPTTSRLAAKHDGHNGRNPDPGGGAQDPAPLPSHPG